MKNGIKIILKPFYLRILYLDSVVIFLCLLGAIKWDGPSISIIVFLSVSKKSTKKSAKYILVKCCNKLNHWRSNLRNITYSRILLRNECFLLLILQQSFCEGYACNLFAIDWISVPYHILSILLSNQLAQKTSRVSRISDRCSIKPILFEDS